MDITISTTILWSIWVAALIFFGVSTGILAFHWKSYSSEDDKNIRRAQHWYYGISIFILLITTLLILFV